MAMIYQQLKRGRNFRLSVFLTALIMLISVSCKVASRFLENDSNTDQTLETSFLKKSNELLLILEQILNDEKGDYEELKQLIILIGEKGDYEELLLQLQKKIKGGQFQLQLKEGQQDNLDKIIQLLLDIGKINKKDDKVMRLSRLSRLLMRLNDYKDDDIADKRDYDRLKIIIQKRFPDRKRLGDFLVNIHPDYKRLGSHVERLKSLRRQIKKGKQFDLDKKERDKLKTFIKKQLKIFKILIKYQGHEQEGEGERQKRRYERQQELQGQKLLLEKEKEKEGSELFKKPQKAREYDYLLTIIQDGFQQE